CQTTRGTVHQNAPLCCYHSLPDAHDSRLSVLPDCHCCLLQLLPHAHSMLLTPLRKLLFSRLSYFIIDQKTTYNTHWQLHREQLSGFQTAFASLKRCSWLCMQHHYTLLADQSKVVCHAV